ncbi:hypothetical protein [Robiginitalea marina]|uniref:DUF4190 domain-containing protein n=1 Tax=Robiginitalea marina TaxID=2954105 RepID=A0ABT1AZJ7_9FLAO|nr:hypothetical protein [Robiginitalea marina]MCO5725010.1 hypothetical protein [Robiginitalea marina]
MEQSYIAKSYKNSLVTLVLLVIGFLLYLLFQDPSGPGAITIVVGITMLIAMVTAVRGMIQLYKGRKEAKNAKFMIALLGNGLGILYLISTIIMAMRIIPKIL